MNFNNTVIELFVIDNQEKTMISYEKQYQNFRIKYTNFYIY